MMRYSVGVTQLGARLAVIVSPNQAGLRVFHASMGRFEMTKRGGRSS